MQTFILTVDGHRIYPRTLGQAFAYIACAARDGKRVTFKRVRL